MSHINAKPGKLDPARVRKQRLEFTWNEDLERELTVRLLRFRDEPAVEGNVWTKLARERGYARDFITKLRALLERQQTAVVHDTDIARAVARIEDKAHALPAQS